MCMFLLFHLNVSCVMFVIFFFMFLCCVVVIAREAHSYCFLLTMLGL